MKKIILSVLTLLFSLSASAESGECKVKGIRSDGNSDFFVISQDLRIKPVLRSQIDSRPPTFSIIDGKDTIKEYESIKFEKISTDVEIKKAAPSQIAVYPNPVEKMIYLSGVDENSQIEVVDMNGVVVKRQLGVEIDVEDLAQGLYVLKVDSSQVKFIKK